MLVANGGIPEKSDIAAALRNAPPELDDLCRLIHTAEVHTFLNVKGLAAHMLDDPIVAQFLDALRVFPVHPRPGPALRRRHNRSARAA